MYMSKNRIILASIALVVIVVAIVVPVFLLKGSDKDEDPPDFDLLPYLSDDQVEARRYSELCDFPDFTELKTIDYQIKSQGNSGFGCIQVGYLCAEKSLECF